MATRLTDKIYIKGSYLDSNVSVTSLSELVNKYDFDGQSVHMAEAFLSENDVAYPIDFWYVPNGDDIKWEIKNAPTIASLKDFENFKDFLNEFNKEAGYLPVSNGFKILVDGEEFEFHINENGEIDWLSTQSMFDETISDAVKLAVDEVTSGASEAFDTLKEIEDWIKANSGSTSVGIQGPQGAKGDTGEVGPQGPQGAKGDRGSQGVQGAEGPQGAKGDRGSQGVQGAKGDTGAQGAEGPQGIQGAKGDTGAQGDRGSQGVQGDRGPQGAQGAKGALDENQILEVIASAKSYTDDEISKIDIPSLDGYATETYVKNAIAEAELSGGDVDLSGYATKDDLIDLYISGTGISIKDNKINVLVESADTENRNYLKVNEDNSLSVEEIGLDDAVTTEEIQVNGGAWADAIKDIYGDKIPVGTSFQDFLKAMSCKEYFVTNITVSSSFTVTCAEVKPGLDGAKSGDIVEVGSEIILNEITGTVTTARQSLSVQGLEYGYKLGENGTYIASKTYSEMSLPILSGASGNKSLRVTFSKFTDSINGGNVIGTKTGENTIGKTTMYAQEGSNKVNIYQTGDTYTSNVNLTGGTIYIATNLKNYYQSDKVTMNTYIPSFPELTKTATASTVYTITGAHKYFIGDITEYNADYWNTDRSEVVRGLATSNWATASTITVPYTFQINTKQQTVVVPSVYTSVAGKDVNNGDVTFNLVKTITFTNEKGYKSQYNVFVAPAYDGLTTESLINITIKK